MALKQFSSHVENVPHRVRLAFLPLLTAIDYACQSNCDRWQFAVEIEQLTALDMAPNDFRWLVRNGWVQHQREVTLESDDGRTFLPSGELTFPERTCFVLTDRGIELAQGLLANHQPAAPERQPSIQPRREATEAVLAGGVNLRAVNGSRPHAGQRPRWDSERRVLGIGGTIVKRFKWVAVNQQAILCAFEEEGWPPRIDDPLPPHPEQDAKRRLSDTIKCLNRKQTNPLVHFRGDGTGEGVVWEFVDLGD
ncbi:hypothetical protein TBK1r_37050 [Stieleria magnilauensis]|uniref:Uncharacterized protein n=2 Tax=Stieleria magnilauensis TaxID=2527963 RepID=A0ABX5XRW7_9BACT|nr:hypothetical protein TBK1r_37050 [Planctomycetes bacterium TBK1r]